MKVTEVPSDEAVSENEMLIKVEGMMCEHCEKRVKDCLEALDEIDIAVSDYKTGTVKLTLNSSIDPKKIKKAVTSAGYKMR